MKETKLVKVPCVYCDETLIYFDINNRNEGNNKFVKGKARKIKCRKCGLRSTFILTKSQFEEVMGRL